MHKGCRAFRDVGYRAPRSYHICLVGGVVTVQKGLDWALEVVDEVAIYMLM